MNVIVVGAGRLGRQFARVLAGAGNAVTVVDQNPATAGKVDTRFVAGDGCEPTVLEEAGAYAADLLVATTGEDEDNLVVSLLAKRQFQVARVVARINDADNTWLFDERWGIDVAVPSAAPLISLIEEATGAFDTVSLRSASSRRSSAPPRRSPVARRHRYRRRCSSARVPTGRAGWAR